MNLKIIYIFTVFQLIILNKTFAENVSYKDGFLKSLGNSSFLDVLIWGIFVFISIIILFFISIILKKYYARKVKNIKVQGIDYKDLDRMKRTGLISEEELAVVKRKIAENFLKSTDIVNSNNDTNIDENIISADDKKPAEIINNYTPAINNALIAENKIESNLTLKKITENIPGNLKAINFENTEKPQLKKKLQPRLREMIKEPNLNKLLADEYINQSEFNTLQSLIIEIKKYTGIQTNLKKL